MYLVYYVILFILNNYYLLFMNAEISCPQPRDVIFRVSDCLGYSPVFDLKERRQKQPPFFMDKLLILCFFSAYFGMRFLKSKNPPSLLFRGKKEKKLNYETKINKCKD